MKKSILVLLIMSVTSMGIYGQYSKKYYGHHLCNKKDFTCKKVNPRHTWKAHFPDVHERDTIKRLNRVNLHHFNRPYIVIPNDPHSMRLSPMPTHIDTLNEKAIVVDLSQQAFGAYDRNGKKIKWGPISGGKAWCADVGRSCKTVTGTFRVTREGGAGCVSRKYDNAPMPYCMFFHRGYAMHGAVLPGHHASHGCVRMFTEDAKWLNHEFVTPGTKIIVKKGFSK